MALSTINSRSALFGPRGDGRTAEAGSLRPRHARGGPVEESGRYQRERGPAPRGDPDSGSDRSDRHIRHGLARRENIVVVRCLYIPGYARKAYSAQNARVYMVSLVESMSWQSGVPMPGHARKACVAQTPRTRETTRTESPRTTTASKTPRPRRKETDGAAHRIAVSPHTQSRGRAAHGQPPIINPRLAQHPGATRMSHAADVGTRRHRPRAHFTRLPFYEGLA